MSREYDLTFTFRTAYWQMVAEIELEAFNQIGWGNFAATVTEIQLIE